MSVSLKIDGSAFKRFVAKIPGGLREAQRVGLKQVGAKWQAHVTKERMRASAVGGVGVRTRTGKLRSGKFDEILEDKESIAVRVGIAGVTYSAIQEFGGTVKAKPGKWLTIPVGPALTGSGVARGRARTFPGLKFRGPFFGPKGQFALLVKPSKNGKGIVYFVLKREVKIPPRLGFYPTWRTWAPANAAKIMLSAVRAKAAKLNKGGA